MSVALRDGASERAPKLVIVNIRVSIPPVSGGEKLLGAAAVIGAADKMRDICIIANTDPTHTLHARNVGWLL